MIPFRRILIAVDATSGAAHAAEVGMELAAALRSELALIHVVDPAVGLVTEAGISAGEGVAMAEQNAHALLASLTRTTGKAHGWQPVREFVEVGAAATQILNAAKEWSADLIVMGSHGHGRIRAALLGSVADSVLREAPCPVLVVRGPDRELIK